MSGFRWRSFTLSSVSSDPILNSDLVDFSACNVQYQSFILVDIRFENESVQFQKGFHDVMPSPLVSIKEWMVRNDPETKDRRLFDHSRIQIIATECLSW